MAGMSIVRKAELKWIERVNIDGWPSRIAPYYENAEHRIRFRLVDFPERAIEPRHVHAGRHGTTVLNGKVLVDGLTLEPLDVILGPSNEPHGPLEYPGGCQLLSAFQGEDYHSEVENLSAEKNYRLVQHAGIPWRPLPSGDGEVKTLIDHGLETMLIEACRFKPGAEHAPGFIAALVFEGSPRVNGETLEAWDLIHPDGDGDAGTVSFPEGGTLLAVSVR